MAAQTLEHEDSYLNAKKGFLSWIVTLDHKRIGIMYLISIGVFFFVVDWIFGLGLNGLLAKLGGLQQ